MRIVEELVAVGAVRSDSFLYTKTQKHSFFSRWVPKKKTRKIHRKTSSQK